MKFSAFAINLNDKCNLRCKYCFITEKGKNEIKYTTLMDFRRFIKKYGKPPIKVDIFGTEPLISWDKLMHVVNMGKIFKWKVGITTNGVLITKDRAEILKENNVSVLVSYDGSRKSHNRFRVSPNGDGTWSRVCKGIKHLRDAEVKYGCAMTVSPENLPYLTHNVKSASERGFQFIALNPQFTVGHNKHKTGYDWEVLRKKYRESASWALRHNVPLMFTLNSFYSYNEGVQKTLTATCGAAKGSVAVDWDGKVYICHRACGREEFRIGDVIDGVTPELVSSFRSRDVNACHSCPVFTQRGACGHCWILAKDMCGDITKIPEEVCVWQSIIHDIDLEIYHRTGGVTRFEVNSIEV